MGRSYPPDASTSRSKAGTARTAKRLVHGRRAASSKHPSPQLATTTVRTGGCAVARAPPPDRSRSGPRPWSRGPDTGPFCANPRTRDDPPPHLGRGPCFPRRVHHRDGDTEMRHLPGDAPARASRSRLDRAVRSHRRQRVERPRRRQHQHVTATAIQKRSVAYSSLQNTPFSSISSSRSSAASSTRRTVGDHTDHWQRRSRSRPWSLHRHRSPPARMRRRTSCCSWLPAIAARRCRISSWTRDPPLLPDQGAALDRGTQNALAVYGGSVQHTFVFEEPARTGPIPERLRGRFRRRWHG
jgi:hypothetical protein